jgi:hypothetical protein
MFDAIGSPYADINWAIACVFKDADGAVHRADYQRAVFEDRLDDETKFER